MRRAIVGGVLCICGVLGIVGFAGCSDSKSDTSENEPAPTNQDPGPNDSSNGPVTIQGVLHLVPDSGCITLQTEQGPVGLTFKDYELENASPPVLVEKKSDRLLANDGDTLIVTGADADPAIAPDDCGKPFTVQSLTSVLPKT